ncbi:MAG: site-2 protease family protein [Chloroherpetonaceae bacterium]|nr:site-2 protease family protein [Chloroherpetonaceae bacterium]
MRDELRNGDERFAPAETLAAEPSADEPFWNRVGEQNYPLHIALFLATFLTTCVAGAYWVGKEISLDDLSNVASRLESGLPYSISLLFFLTSHEFGHFFATMAHRVRATLPYYIPMPPIPFIFPIGTFGAMIRMKERIPTSQSLFDIGAGGPLAGFVVALGILIYGFATLPPIEYVVQIHPEYELYYQLHGKIPVQSGALFAGKNLLYWILEKIFDGPNLPPMTEMYHYPYLFAGWLGCFVTALNLLPVGQLDGGHIVYAMFGRKVQARVARIFLAFIVVLGLPTFAEWIAFILATFANQPFSGFPYPAWVRDVSWASWIVWALLLWRFVRLDHPPVLLERPLDPTRMTLGWISIAVFVLCFTPVPFGQLP